MNITPLGAAGEVTGSAYLVETKNAKARLVEAGQRWAIRVKAHITTINGLSGYTGQGELLEWVDSLAGARPRVVITHGADESRKALAKLINERHHLRPVLPAEGQSLELN